MANSSGTGYHPVTRWLHAGLVLGVIFQLFLAIFMAHPDHQPGKHGEQASSHASATTEAAPSAHNAGEHNKQISNQPSKTAAMPLSDHKDGGLERFLMQTHRTGGLAVVLIVLLNLIWAILLRGSPRKRQLSVLFSLQHWREALLIAKDLPLMMLNKRALPEPGNALSLIFEMLGLLIMAVMAITGSIIWNLWGGPASTVPDQAEILMGIHGTAASLLFIYLTGHISMALMHARAGDPVFARILPLVKRMIISQGGK